MNGGVDTSRPAQPASRQVVITQEFVNALSARMGSEQNLDPEALMTIAFKLGLDVSALPTQERQANALVTFVCKAWFERTPREDLFSPLLRSLESSSPGVDWVSDQLDPAPASSPSSVTETEAYQLWTSLNTYFGEEDLRTLVDFDGAIQEGAIPWNNGKGEVVRVIVGQLLSAGDEAFGRWVNRVAQYRPNAAHQLPQRFLDSTLR